MIEKKFLKMVESLNMICRNLSFSRIFQLFITLSSSFHLISPAFLMRLCPLTLNFIMDFILRFGVPFSLLICFYFFKGKIRFLRINHSVFRIFFDSHENLRLWFISFLSLLLPPYFSHGFQMMWSLPFFHKLFSLTFISLTHFWIKSLHLLHFHCSFSF